MKNFVEKGNVLNYKVPNATTITSGQLVFAGALVGVAATSSSTEGAIVAVNLEGVFEFSKTTPLVIAQGDRLYWNAGTSKITKTVGDVFVGIAYEAALSAGTTVLVRLSNEGGGSGAAQAANVAQNATANGSDLATTQALANSLKTTVNAILTSLKNAGVMDPD